jgi:hypothetical protein
LLIFSLAERFVGNFDPDQRQRTIGHKNPA